MRKNDASSYPFLAKMLKKLGAKVEVSSKDIKEIKVHLGNTEKSLHGLEEIMDFLVKNCVTHRELNDLATKFDGKLGSLETKVDEKFEKIGTRMRSDIADFKDAILHELVKIRENQEILGYQRTRTDDHEKRIEHLEVHAGIAVS